MSVEAHLKLEALRRAYAESLPGRLMFIEQQWHKLKQHFDKALCAELHRGVHALSGSAGVYGYNELGQACRDLAIYLQQLLEAHELNNIQKSEIAHLLAQIKETQPANKDQQAYCIPKKDSCSKTVLYLAAPQNPSHQALKNNLAQLGYQLVLIHSLKELTQALKLQLPAVLVIDEAHLNDALNQALEHSSGAQVPMICLSEHDDFDVRLRAMRAGVSVFLHLPVELFHLSNQIVQLCNLSLREDYRVLILDDSELLASYYTLVLEEAGMSVRAIVSPDMLMHELQNFKPNLLLLDLYLQGCTGFDIAKIVRQEESYMSLPIIFISTEHDRMKQLAILNSCGADDFLTKPVLPQNLVAAVKSRAQRAALINAYIALDSLTKLLNHSHILKQLEFEILRAERFNQKIAVAMIDIDYFKKINDKYGHQVGDMVLKKMAELFFGRVRKTDYIGRYGGDEFSIIFPNTTQDEAAQLCHALCEQIAAQRFDVDNEHFYVTLSIGIGAYPKHLTANSLVAAADSALYQSKLKGRNCVSFAD